MCKNTQRRKKNVIVWLGFLDPLLQFISYSLQIPGGNVQSRSQTADIDGDDILERPDAVCIYISRAIKHGYVLPGYRLERDRGTRLGCS